jgi:mRNA interferase RelE/StbE
MDKYSIMFARSARKELELLSAPVIGRVFSAIESLATAPRPRGCRKLQGVENLWRVRVGEYRIIYSIDDENRIVDVIAVRHRSAAYE